MDTNRETRNRAIGGIALILLGLLAFIVQFIDISWLGFLVLPTLALIFAAWGILTRQSGLLIPAGILGGLGLGTYLIAGPYEGWADDRGAALFMLAFALGWVMIPVLSILFTKDRHLWALIPAAIMAFVGFALLSGDAGLAAITFLGRLWPLFLIAIGLYIIFRREHVDEGKPIEKYQG